MNVPSGKLTNGLIIANVLVFLLIWLLGWEQQAVLRGGLFPVRLSGEIIDSAAHGWMVPAWLTPLSSAFLHSGFIHIGFNMVMLLFCGRFVEQALGPQLMALLYLFGAYAAAFAEFAVDSQSMIPVIGASGAISAVIGGLCDAVRAQSGRAAGADTWLCRANNLAVAGMDSDPADDRGRDQRWSQRHRHFRAYRWICRGRAADPPAASVALS